MPLRIIGILLICFILVNLFVGLVNIVRDRSKTNRVARNLTIRIVLSVLLFIVAMAAIFFEGSSV